MKSKKICPLATRIKKMMQTDDDVGKISQATPILIGRAMELFLEKLCKQAIGVAQSRQAKTLTPSHLKAAVTADTTLDFLAELVASAPDLPPPDADGGDGAPKPVKRRRTNDVGDGPGSPAGRGRSKQQQADRADPASGEASGDTPAPKPRSRAPKAAAACAAASGSGPPSRAASGNLGDQPQPANGGGAAPSGRRGGGRPRKDAKGAAAASAAAGGSAGEPGGLQSDIPVIVPQLSLGGQGGLSGLGGLGGLNSMVPHSAAMTSPVEVTVGDAAGGAARQGVSAENGAAAAASAASAAAAASAAPAVKPEPSSGAACGAAAGGSGGSVIASLRAQQPFFGLGRRGKNLGVKGGGGGGGGGAGGMTPAAPSPAAVLAMQQQMAQQLSEAGAGVLGLAPLAAGGLPGQAGFALKLEPLDLSRPAMPLMGLLHPPAQAELAAHREGDVPMEDAGGGGPDADNGPGAAVVKAEGNDGGIAHTSTLSPFEMRHHMASSAAGSGPATSGLDAGAPSTGSEPARPPPATAALAPSGSLEQPPAHLGMASSGQLPPLAGVGAGATVGVNGASSGATLPQFGPSLALFQSQGDMDDDYDDC